MASKKRQAPRRRAPAVFLAEQQPDRRVALGVAAGAALIFFSTYSPRVGLGDSAESVAGVETLGILHAPGYPVYVLAARVFTLLVPFGELSARVNLFSLVCAVGAVTLTFLIAQRLGASKIAAAAGALTLATGTSFWFYATFAKHYPFSALLVTGATYLVVRWLGSPQLWRLLVAAALLGLLTGAAWQLAVLALPPLALMVLVQRRPPVGHVVMSAAVFLVMAAGVVAYTLIRASQNPAMNWGGASNFDRFVDLVTMEDFGFGWNAFGADEEASVKAVNNRDLAQFPARTARYLVLLSREWSVVAVLLAAIGVVAARRNRAVVTFFAAAIVVNLIGAGLVIGLRVLPNVNTVLAQGGFLTGLFVVLAVAVSLGLDAVARVVAGMRSNRGRRWVLPATAAALGVVLVAPALVTHQAVANHRIPPYADQYAENVLSTLPEDAVLFAWGAERAFPLVHAQSVGGMRPDVLVVYADALYRPWYQEQVTRKLDIDIPASGERVALAADAVRQSAELRPTFLDMRAVNVLRDELEYRPRGLVAEYAEGSRRVVLTAAEIREVEEIIAGYATDGVYHDRYRRRFPNGRVLRQYADMHLEMSGQYLSLRDMEAVGRHIDLANQVKDQAATRTSTE